MEIAAIKQQLSIGAVLHHYGLQPDNNNRLLCPFHPDKTPSLQIYPLTDTYCCFSARCKAGAGDVIQFIQLKESCSKHEALLKATALVTGETSAAALQSPVQRTTDDTPANEPIARVDKVGLLTQVFSYYKTGLPRTKKAVEYVQHRGLDYSKHEIAFNSGSMHADTQYQHLLPAMLQWGLLKPRAGKGYTVWAKDCIWFPLKNGNEAIVSLYGRSITDDEDQRHFYLAGREGLYPGYPSPVCKKIILTESIIDAASVLAQRRITTEYEVLALYGTNGLTQEHLKALLALSELQEVILMLNADGPGEAATVKHYHTLKKLSPDLSISQVSLPEGEDVNSVLCNHDDAGVLFDLITNRKLLELKETSDKTLTPSALQLPLLETGALNTSNPELLIYEEGGLRIEVLGGIKIAGLRSEERRVGKECNRRCRSRWSPYH